ncbi:class I SAM-dependent methyltransferase [Aureimonas frigidaquae]|uniref:class I SAM-dependent methyltransferase n=1 Tax=Aureimonas frigidaquae TaxID=424757 RepID=UPI000785D558|nr:SAM-dependent methyltransferase [Aureimonas frigidaquae]
MSTLERRIRERIAAEGPLPLDAFWNMALFDPDGGYYTTRQDPIGAAGDFTTAPEISQMFGELLAAWTLAAWRALGAPDPVALVEIGPGRGTLMDDMLRTLRRLDPAFLRAARIHLVEVSDRLRRIQATRLAPHDLPLHHVPRLDRVPAMPLISVANELFDAIAIRQFRLAGALWRERRIGTAPDGTLLWLDGPPVDGTMLPLPPGVEPAEGDIFEWSPAREALALALGRRIAAHGGAALFLDYGHARSAFGDTLQALRNHAYADPLQAVGRQDLTSHVDFARLAEALGAGGAIASPVMAQGPFLLALGLAERAGALGAQRDAAGRASITAAAHRLAGDRPGEMGQLFKVLAASSRPIALPPFD